MGYKLSLHRLPMEKRGRGLGRRTKEQREDDLLRHEESAARIKKKQEGFTVELALHKLKTQWLHQIKYRATAKNVPFDLTLEDLDLPEVCPILGIPLKFNKNGADDDSYSMDRIDNTKGYTKNNVQIISLKANKLKNNGTLDELIKMGEWAAARKAFLENCS